MFFGRPEQWYGEYLRYATELSYVSVWKLFCICVIFHHRKALKTEGFHENSWSVLGEFVLAESDGCGKERKAREARRPQGSVCAHPGIHFPKPAHVAAQAAHPSSLPPTAGTTLAPSLAASDCWLIHAVSALLGCFLEP